MRRWWGVGGLIRARIAGARTSAGSRVIARRAGGLSKSRDVFRVSIVYCQACGTGYGSLGERPVKCPSCDREPQWRDTPPYADPKVPYELTTNDRRFLHKLQVAVESN
jgi:hypothetical protein